MRNGEAMSEGQLFVLALADKDAVALKRLLHPDLEFRALTPRRTWEEGRAEAVVDDVLLGTWFGPAASITEIVAMDTAPVGARHRVSYRLRVEREDGSFLVEQQASYDLDGDRIARLHLMCAGFQPTAAAGADGGSAAPGQLPPSPPQDLSTLPTARSHGRSRR